MQFKELEKWMKINEQIFSKIILNTKIMGMLKEEKGAEIIFEEITLTTSFIWWKPTIHIQKLNILQEG